MGFGPGRGRVAGGSTRAVYACPVLVREARLDPSARQLLPDVTVGGPRSNCGTPTAPERGSSSIRSSHG